ncbi:uncharacterized protein TNCV_4740591 [Trichonephila clavipes]|nr:uncharacterized protein TNCV_4740591 [Trichonephila clavipes]
MKFLKNRQDFFKDLRLDTALNEMLCEAREFDDEIDIPANFELIQPRHRVRRRNVNFDYEALENPIEQGWRTSGTRAIADTRHNIFGVPVIKMVYILFQS